MQRFEFLQKILKSDPSPSEVFLNLSDFYTDSQSALKSKIRIFLHKNIGTSLNNFYDKAELPLSLINNLRELDLFTPFLQSPYGKAESSMSLAFIIMELARFDASLATFYWLQMVVNMHTIEQLGSENQKKYYLPKMAKLELICGWALTEPMIGSDASNLLTTAYPNDKGFIIEGQKKWIGNGSFDFNIVWAKNNSTQQINAFIVENNRENVNFKTINHKLALRIVQNIELNYNKVQIPYENKLEKAKNFSSTTKMLSNSRVFVIWIAVGISFQVYDICIEFSKTRVQFNTPVGSFQLVQEKLSRIIGNCNAIFLLCWRMTKLYENKTFSIGQISLCKASVTLKARETVSLAREILGGDGILIDSGVMKAFCDMEAVFTYEGTYDVNSLVAGRELTGISAFKNGK